MAKTKNGFSTGKGFLKEVDKAIEAQYASSDHSKGTIEERLTALGFKEGVIANLVAIASTNFLKRQGNYVIGKLELNQSFSYSNSTVIGNIPTNFKPKVDEYVYAPFSDIDYSGATQSYYYGLLKLKISTNGEITIDSFDGDRYILYSSTQQTYVRHTEQTVFDGSIHELRIQFGYEASPIQ